MQPSEYPPSNPPRVAALTPLEKARILRAVAAGQTAVQRALRGLPPLTRAMCQGDPTTPPGPSDGRDQGPRRLSP